MWYAKGREDFYKRPDIAPRMRYTRFEKARVIGARGLQIALGAPVLVEIPQDMVDPIEIANLEYDEGMIPISIRH